jgi:hypothetical protein
MIYKYTLSDHCFRFGNDTPTRAVPYQYDVRVHHVLALTSACRQTHAETANVIFSENYFGNDSEDDSEGAALVEGVNGLASFQREAIRRVQVNFCCAICFFADECNFANLFTSLSGLQELAIVASQKPEDIEDSCDVAELQALVNQHVGRPAVLHLESACSI